MNSGLSRQLHLCEAKTVPVGCRKPRVMTHPELWLDTGRNSTNQDHLLSPGVRLRHQGCAVADLLGVENRGGSFSTSESRVKHLKMDET